MRACYLSLALLCAASALNAQVKRVLYLTHSAGFRHDSIDVSKRVLNDLAATSGKFEIVSTEDLAAISEASLRQFDAVLFFTSGELALSDAQKSALLAFVRSGKGFAGVHSATDTLYSWADYGDLIGGYFDGHPWVQEVGIDVEDTDHPAVKHLAPSFRITEEIYQFRAFSRDRVRVLMTLDTGTVDLRASGVKRTDGDFALAWTRLHGQGRVFYTALGHFDETWRDPRFQTMMLNALLWATGDLNAESAPRRAAPVVGGVSTIPAGVDDLIAPGGLIAIHGTGLTAGSSASAAAVPLPVKLAGTSVRINGVLLPLFEISPSRIVAQAPYNLTAPAGLIVSTGASDNSSTREVAIAPAAPRIVAVAGGRSAGYVVIYATGLGAVNIEVGAGAAASVQPLARTVVEPVVRIGGVAARVMFSGLAPGLVGVYQVNAEWPAGVESAAAEIALESGGRISTAVP
jgi:uncharacterized protein (TIGR03437 family)